MIQKHLPPQQIAVSSSIGNETNDNASKKSTASPKDQNLDEILVDSSLESDTSVLSSSSLSASSSPSSTSNSNSNNINNVLVSSADEASEASLLQTIVHDFTRNIHSDEKLIVHSDRVLASYNEALCQDSQLTMLPNIDIHPSGDESGNFLVIDLGGSTLRVAVVQLNQPQAQTGVAPNSKCKLVLEKKWVVENNNKVIDAGFFKWVSSKIIETLHEQDVIDINGGAPVNTGITWSFPLEQSSYNHGLIQHMGKGYTVSPEAYKKDLKTLLELSTLQNFNLVIDVKVLINDSLAVYAAGSFIDKYMKLAIVLGTGFNACCGVKTDLVHQNKRLGNEKSVLLNTEASLFGHVLREDICTNYDTIIDYRMNSDYKLNFLPHMELDTDGTIIQPSEYMNSGRYLPELTRLVVIDLINEQAIFEQIPSSKLKEAFKTPYDGFQGELMCFIAENDDHDKISHKISQTYDWDEQDIITQADIISLKTVIECIINRAAYISAVMIIGILKLMKQHNQFVDTQVNIGFVGSVLDYFHTYRATILKYINGNNDIKLMGITVGFNAVDNSSIVGAAVGAAYFAEQK